MGKLKALSLLENHILEIEDMSRHRIQKHNCSSTDISTIALVTVAEVGLMALNVVALKTSNKIDFAPAVAYHFTSLAVYTGVSTIAVDHIGVTSTLAIGIGSNILWSMYKFGIEEGAFFNTITNMSVGPLMFISELTPLFFGSSYRDCISTKNDEDSNLLGVVDNAV